MKSISSQLLKPKSRKKPSHQPSSDPEQPHPIKAIVPAAFQGDLAALAIENVFQLFDFAGLSGKLVVQSTANSGSFYFRKGVLIHGLLRVSNRKIGQILVESGLLSEELLEESLSLHLQAGTSQRFGQFLLERGYVAPDRLEQSLLSQAKEAFFEVLSWNVGTFCYYPDQMPGPDEVKLHARIDHLLLEGMIHIDQSTLNL